MSTVPESVLVRVLGQVELVIDGTLTPLPGDRLQRLLVELVLAGEQGLSAEALRLNVWPAGSRPERNGLQQLARRLRSTGLGDHLPRVADGRYRLALRTDQVDVWQVIATAHRLDEDGSVDDSTLAAAISLWRGPPAAGVDTARGVRVTRAYHRLVAEQRRRHKPRVLIVDDKVGRSIESVLGDFHCTVLTDVESFWAIADRCDELFDAALVDLHLDAADSAAQGLAVVGSLQRTSTVPAVLMTYRPAEGDFAELASRYNLFGTFIKSSNDPSGNFSGLRHKVEEMIGDGVEDLLIDRADAELGRSERKARKRIRYLRRGDVARHGMEQEADAIRAKIRAGAGLGEVRSALTAFRRQWLEED